MRLRDAIEQEVKQAEGHWEYAATKGIPELKREAARRLDQAYRTRYLAKMVAELTATGR